MIMPPNLRRGQAGVPRVDSFHFIFFHSIHSVPVHWIHLDIPVHPKRMKDQTLWHPGRFCSTKKAKVV